MRVSDLLHFEDQCRQSRGWKRGEMCRMLGISQAKWRRAIEGLDPGTEVEDRTLGLAMSAIWAGLVPYSDMQFTRLNHQDYEASGKVAARRIHIVHFVTWPEESANEKA